MLVAAVHFTPAFGELRANRKALVDCVREAADAGARVVVLPELATTGFALDAETAERWAEAIDGPTAAALGAASAERETTVVVGLPLREEGRLHNAQLVLDRGRVAGVYRKHHLYGCDFVWAAPGPSAGAVVETSAGAVGLLVCHDLAYPRTVAAVAAERPRLLAFSTAWIGSGESLPAEWLLAVRLLDPAPLVAANRGGREGTLRFADPSAILSHARGGIVGPRGAARRVLVAEV